MWGLDNLSIPGVSLANGLVTAPAWMAGLALGLVVLFLIVALLRGGAMGTLSFITIAGAAVWLTLAWYDSDQASDRRSIETRIAALETQAFASGNPIACVDTFSGDPLDAACEKTLFAAPETVAAAGSYVAARLILLGEALTFAARRDPKFENKLGQIRSALERDRFGIVAHVLEVGNKCTAQQCDAYTLFRDPARVRANLKEKTYETLVARYAPSWNSARGTQPTVAAPLPPNYNLPSASSIPPISIMSNEPTTTATTPPPPAEPRAAAPAQPRARPRPLPPPPTVAQ